MKRFISILLLTSLLVGGSWLRADVRMPLIFGNHMVLQQDGKLSIWGWAESGEKVKVSFLGQEATAVAGADGKWMVNLKPVKQQKEGATLTVTGNNELIFTDVLVGDVWVASGQSNMEWGLKLKKDYAEDVAQSADSLLRLFFVPKNTSLEPLTNIEKPKGTENPRVAARWVLCNPKNLFEINGQGFSAAAFYFARDMRAARKCPVGIIQSAWGGTRAEAWTSISGLKQEPSLKHYVDRYEQNVKNNPEIMQNFAQRKREFDIAIREWNRTVGKEWDQAQKEWAVEVKKAQKEGRQAPPKPEPRTKRPSDPPKPNGGNNGPSNLFNAMISPLMPLSIKGVIWYQGEFNSGGSGKEYATLFPRMIKDWREKWGIGDFPFLFVQLPNFGPVDTEPSAEGGGWRWVREGQVKALDLPNTAMATTIDIGDVIELHPADKYDVGHRLALAARRLAHNEKIVGMGPLYKGMQVKGDKIIIEFSNQGKKLVMGTSPYVPAGASKPAKPTKLTGFGMAGSDQKFYWADAVIQGNKVVVSSEKVKEPVAVRYGFSNSPLCNLYNEAGLPASPFRTDNWEK
ncbi:sialate O-acetylesterase [Bacteroides ovatus]|uniref:Sialate O-acetylesterase n=1 Tax=Bacteroides ovatus TaxID=28116 RepID=A0A1G8CPN6_BACOV|nr:sialate O-acetylesterase [Bacteroides ovatus]SDH47445.1 sialate O-acetylesterase [Bacteroides ovatus]